MQSKAGKAPRREPPQVRSSSLLFALNKLTWPVLEWGKGGRGGQDVLLPTTSTEESAPCEEKPPVTMSTSWLSLSLSISLFFSLSLSISLFFSLSFSTNAPVKLIRTVGRRRWLMENMFPNENPGVNAVF